MSLPSLVINFGSGIVLGILGSELDPDVIQIMSIVPSLLGGVVNLLTGHPDELLPWLAGHMDVNALDLTGCPDDLAGDVEATAAENVKRVHRAPDVDPYDPRAQSPSEITALLELKTVWHPMGA